MIDLVFLADGSGSIGSGNWEIMKDFMADFVDKTGAGINGTHVSLVTFSSGVYLNFGLTQ